MFHCPRSHFLPAALNFFFLFPFLPPSPPPHPHGSLVHAGRNAPGRVGVGGGGAAVVQIRQIWPSELSQPPPLAPPPPSDFLASPLSPLMLVWECVAGGARGVDLMESEHHGRAQPAAQQTSTRRRAVAAVATRSDLAQCYHTIF